MKPYPNDAHALTGALDFISSEARHDVIDTVYCQLFNLAGSLEGITAEGDLEWFARRLYERQQPYQARWDNLPEAEKQYWLSIGRVAAEELPALMSRQATRLREYIKTLNTILVAARAEAKGRKS